jgi:hypothetical protein
MIRPWFSLLAICFVGVLGCDTGAEAKKAAGLAAEHPGESGPSVVHDSLNQPVPEVPFPNDLLLHPTDTTATGQRWNISTQAPTHLERRLRRQLNTLDGFGPFAPIALSFDGPIDLKTVNDDTVLVVNIEEGHKHEGRVAFLDLGRGYFPAEATRVRAYWGYDPMEALPDFLLGEKNHADLDGDGTEERIYHYDFATNTLMLRPVMPLDQGATHAVLIMRGVRGWSSEALKSEASQPVRSPFENKAHAAQTKDVARALELLALESTDLAFGWTFTTAHMAQDMVNLRRGLYSDGPLKRLGSDFKPTFSEIRSLDDLNEFTIYGAGNIKLDPTDHAYTLQPQVLSDIMDVLGNVIPMISGGLTNVDYVVFGSYESPDVRTGEHKGLGLNTHTGEGEVGVATVPFMLSVPKETEKHKAPFPVVLYFHGTNTSRLEMLAIMDSLARQGVAGLSIDEAGHGPIVSDLPLLFEGDSLTPELLDLAIPVLVEFMAPHRVDEFMGLTTYEALAKLEEVPLFAEFGVIGRAEDTNGDGIAASGESFFSADPFKLCGSFQQDLVDFFQLVRILRSFDQSKVPDAIANPREASVDRLMQNLMAGDFNADGVLDIGGSDVHLGTAGTSLGGFHAVMAAALEPEVGVAAPIVGGAGFGDVMLRTRLSMVAEPIYHEIFGPLIVGCPDGEGGVYLSFNNDADECKEAAAQEHSFAHIPSIAPESVVTLTNLYNGQSKEVTSYPDGGFSVSVESDTWDQLEIQLQTGDAGVLNVLAQTPYSGSGFDRNSPDFRRFWTISQQVLDRCDPATLAHHLFRDPLEGHPPVNLLLENALGDATVPISTGITLARISGALGKSREEWEPIMQQLIDRNVVDGASDYDVDDALQDNAIDSSPIGPFTPVDTGRGVATIRFADVDGKHEWIGAVNQAAELDRAMYSQSRISLFLKADGAWVTDDLCIADVQSQCLDEPENYFP